MTSLDAVEQTERVFYHFVVYQGRDALVCSCGSVIRRRLSYSLAQDFGAHIREALAEREATR